MKHQYQILFIYSFSSKSSIKCAMIETSTVVNRWRWVVLCYCCYLCNFTTITGNRIPRSITDFSITVRSTSSWMYVCIEWKWKKSRQWCAWVFASQWWHRKIVFFIIKSLKARNIMLHRYGVHYFLKIMRIGGGGVENLSFFESVILIFFFQNFFLFHPYSDQSQFFQGGTKGKMLKKQCVVLAIFQQFFLWFPLGNYEKNSSK